MKVLVVNKSSHDFSDAKRFGEVVFLTEGRLPKYQVAQMIRLFNPAIEASASDDYILVTGLTVAVASLCCLFVLKHGRLNLLIHEPKTNRYLERVVNFKED